MSIVLSAQNLVRTLQEELPVPLVRGISLDIQAGKFTAITGPSGSGKSSLLYLLGLLDRPTSGAVLFDGKDTSLLSDDAMAAVRLRKLGFVFQFHFLLPEFSALENVMMPMQRAGDMPLSVIRGKAEKVLDDLGLSQHTRKLPGQLSGGQRQRVAIARALANDPLIVFADEPTGNLDSVSAAAVQDLLRNIAHTENRAVVAVTHDTAFAEMADVRFHIVDGKLSEL